MPMLLPERSYLCLNVLRKSTYEYLRSEGIRSALPPGTPASCCSVRLATAKTQKPRSVAPVGLEQTPLSPVVQPRLKAYQQIVRCFGTGILLESGEINREALGNIIFSHPEKRRLLNAITHPEIQKEMLKQVLKYFVLGYRYVILDIPLLFETNRLTKFMKHTVLVYCDPQTQLSRLMKRNGLCQAEAEARVASQLPLDEKRKLASHVIDNSGDRESTRRQVLRLHARLEDSLDFLWARLAVGAAVAGLGGLVYLLLRHFIS
ncbi:dephospho-CoA kinase domain-containing protein isoform X1 [Cygnus olor]|uniref:dephospho-CoA kinase domain-containing protein isoform X1 n=1 Tax=Cygnus olor TaxID=8869 RepID=UPI001ADE57CA|nr:dephospho-CoA kinase domain-containing protein isoform X1 [Cygnus olor]XP_040392311.1 dephospho-CoA kinase domain-containing protein isoform X1 [Cygnus olor]